MLDSFKPAIQALQAKNAPLEESIRPVVEQINANKRLINQLCEAAGVAPLHPEVDQPATSSKKLGPTLPDEYTGRALATVIREILEQRKKVGLGAIHIDDLYDTMRAGGYLFDTKDAAKAKSNMAVSLGKNAIFARVGETSHWGLAEWYPNLKRERKMATASAGGMVSSAPAGSPQPLADDDEIEEVDLPPSPAR